MAKEDPESKALSIFRLLKFMHRNVFIHVFIFFYQREDLPLATPMVTPQEGWRFADIQMVHTEHSSDRKPLLTKAALYNPISKSEDKSDGPNTLCQEDSIKSAEK